MPDGRDADTPLRNTSSEPRAVAFDRETVLSFALSDPSRSRPHLTAYAPMIRAGDTEQNPTRVKNLLKEAREALALAGLGKREVTAVVEPVEQRASGRDFAEHQDDGLAILAEAGRCLVVKCPQAFAQQVTVEERHHLLPLLTLLGQPSRFTVLALSQKRVRLIAAHRERGVDIADSIAHLPHRLTDVAGTVVRQDSLQQHSPQRGAPIFHGQGAGEDDEQAELERYLSRVAEALSAALGNESRVVLAGDTRLIAMFRRVAKGLRLEEEAIAGNHDNTPANSLAARGFELVLEASSARAAALAQRFDREAGRGHAISAASAVPEAADQGRVEVLLVDAALAASPEPSAQRRMANRATHATLHNRGSVHAVESTRMPSGTPLAALLRY